MGNNHHHHHHDLLFSLSNYGGFREKVQGVGSWNQVPTLLNLLLSPNTTMTQVMRDGIALQSGKYKDLLESSTDFGALVAAQDTSMELVEQSTNVNDDSEPHESPKSQNLPSPRPKEANGENGFGDQPKSQKGTSKLIKDEEREKGQVSLQVYKTYSTEVYGWWGVIAVLSISLLRQGPLMAGDYWLAYENGDDHTFSFNPSFCIRIYAIIPAVSCVLVMAKLYLPHVGLKTAQLFFEQIIYSILHAPMSFFYTTPSGRVLSRASRNQTNIDLFLPFFITLKLAMYIMVLSIGIIICQVAWLIILIIIPLAWFNIWYRGYYLATSRELTHLDSITKAPVIHHFSESVSGVMTIRCFRKLARFYQENIDRVNANLCMDFHNNGSNEWLGFRLELFGSFVLCLAAVFMVLLPSNVIKPGIYST